MIKLIIDTDIGDDIDDALAIAFALGSPEFDILGITTVYGDVITRAKIAKKLCLAVDKQDIPIVPGEEFPLAGEYYPDTAPEKLSQADSIIRSGIGVDTSVPAYRFIIDTAEKFPGEVFVVTIGAMTNVAKAIQESPDFKDNIAEVVSLAGFLPPRLLQPEWNVRYDPEAAKVIAESGIQWSVIGADAARHIGLGRGELDEFPKAGSDKSEFLIKLILLWARNKSGWDAQHIFDVPGAHTADVATVLAFIAHDTFQFQQGTVTVDANGTFQFKESEDGPHNLATEAPKGSYTEIIMERIIGSHRS